MFFIFCSFLLWWNLPLFSLYVSAYNCLVSVETEEMLCTHWYSSVYSPLSSSLCEADSLNNFCPWMGALGSTICAAMDRLDPFFCIQFSIGLKILVLDLAVCLLLFSFWNSKHSYNKSFLHYTVLLWNCSPFILFSIVFWGIQNGFVTKQQRTTV